jgi:hypothetical protein
LPPSTASVTNAAGAGIIWIDVNLVCVAAWPDHQRPQVMATTLPCGDQLDALKRRRPQRGQRPLVVDVTVLAGE